MKKVVIGSLTVGAVMSLVAWWNLDLAATRLADARSVQERKAPEGGGQPPQLDEYRAILDTLDESLRIREEIDDVLGRIESSVAEIAGRQDDAIDVVSSAHDRVDAITRSLAAAVRSAQISDRSLLSLRSKLEISAGLARAIAEELEELDQSMGPATGREP